MGSGPRSSMPWPTIFWVACCTICVRTGNSPTTTITTRSRSPGWASFLEEACNRYLATLLGDGTRLEMAFPAGVYQQWLYRTAREMIYWTARQTEGQEGFGLHFNRDGRPCAELYPGHPQLKGIRYGVADEFTEEAGESLGTDSGKLPLFYLMRGIYMLTAKVADRLGRS